MTMKHTIGIALALTFPGSTAASADGRDRGGLGRCFRHHLGAMETIDRPTLA
jgi:hypothetical protein